MDPDAVDAATLDRREANARRLKFGGLAFAVLLVAFGVWKAASNTAGARREVPDQPVIALTPPPPPPPPPKITPPEPQKTDETPKPVPSPEPPKAAAPAKSSAPQQLTIAGAAQAGSDAFGVQAGKGGGGMVGGDPNGTGMGGGDFGEANYSRYLKTTLQQAVQSDERISRLFFAAQVNIWIGGDGRIERVAIVRSSGDAATDQALVAALQELGRLDEPPPPQLRFPAHIALRGRRA